MKHSQRVFETTLADRLKEEPRFIQIVMGPRQVGKTTGVQAFLEQKFAGKYLYHECEDALHTSDLVSDPSSKSRRTKDKDSCI